MYYKRGRKGLGNRFLNIATDKNKIIDFLKSVTITYINNLYNLYRISEDLFSFVDGLPFEVDLYFSDEVKEPKISNRSIYRYKQLYNNQFLNIKIEIINHNIQPLRFFYYLINNFINELFNLTDISFLTNDELEVEVQENILRNRSYDYAVANAEAFFARELKIALTTVRHIAATTYEKRNCSNFEIVFAESGSPTISFCDIPFVISETRQIRKILETCTSGYGLFVDISDTPSVKGLISKEDIDKCETHYKIIINSSHKWSMYYDNQLVIVYEKEMYKALKCSQKIIDNIDENDWRFLATHIYKIKDKTNIENGALFIVFQNKKVLEAELKRLKTYNRLYCLDVPININVNNIKNLSSIDGAVFVYEKKIYATAAILDGLVTCEGDRSRGSRLNSSRTYIEYIYNDYSKESYVEESIIAYAIVISDDGGFDLIRNKINSG